MQKANKVIISVKGKAIGIKPENAKKIFDRYYRVQSNIWVASEIDKGSTFYFSLPL